MEPINIVFIPQTQAILSLLLVIAGSILFRRFRGWPSLLILVGTAGFFVMHLSNAISAYTDYRLAPQGSQLLRWWSIVDNVSGVATVCFPIGLLAFACERRKTSNQAMQTGYD